VCATLAVLNAAVWATVTPTWQVPDEPAHFGYAQYLAETGKPPREVDVLPGHFNLSEEETAGFTGVPFSYQGTPTWVKATNDVVQSQLRGKLNRVNEAGAGAAATYPPLYYAYEAIPYKLGSGATLFTRVFLMRLFSALLAGATVAFTFLFLRELMPSSPRAWTVGALAVAFQPLAAFVSGGVNPDGGLWTASAALIWLLARGFRHGLSARLGLAIGVAITCALLIKGSSFALLPPAAFGLACLAWRARQAGEPLTRTLRPLALAAVVPAVVFLAWLLISTRSYDRGGGVVTGGLTSAPKTSIGEQLNYLWQTFLPRLPFMNEQFSGRVPIWNDYFQGFVGRFGYAQYAFPVWVSKLALIVAAAVLGLAAAALVRARGLLRGRLLEAATYVVFVASLLLLVGVAGYNFRKNVGLPFEQTRYLFPLLPLYAGLVAVAVRGAGRRFGAGVAGALVALFVVHNFFSILLSLERYYS
jgi:hypothetical protein